MGYLPVGNDLVIWTKHLTTFIAYEESESAVVTDISIKTPPTKTVYTEGENLDLAGLEVTLTKSNASTQEVDPADFADNGITTDKANGVTLTTGDTAVVIMANGHTVSQPITVNALPKSSDVTVTSGTYAVSDDTITNIPFGTTLANFKAAIAPATGATFEVYESDGTTVATDLASEYKVIVTAEDATTTKIYNIAVNADPNIATVAAAKLAISSASYTDLQVTDTENQDQKTSAVQNAVNTAKNDGSVTATVIFDTPNYSVAISKGAVSDTYIIETATFSQSDADAATLATAKTSAHNALASALSSYNETDYTSDNWITLTGFKTSGDANIDASGNIGEVTSAQTTATDGMAGVETIAETDISDVNADKSALSDASIQGANSDLSNIIVALTNPLPSVGANGSTITWTSNMPNIVSGDGQTINRPDFASGNTTVIMTAAITKGNASDTKAFTLTVIKLPASNIATITSGTYTIGADTITNVPLETSKTNFLAVLTKGQVNQTWDDSGIANPVVTGNTLAVTAQDGTTSVTYTVTTDADMTAYNGALAAVNQTDYTTATWEAYQIVVSTNAKTNQDSQESVNIAKDNIIVAQASLVHVANLNAYNEALGAVNQADYTDASWTAYQTIVDDNVVTNQNTQSEVDLATENITAAQDDLFGRNKIVPDSDGKVTLSGDTTEVVITDPNQAVHVTIASGTVNPKINVSAFIANGTGKLPEITISSDVADIVIPAGTTVTSVDPSWDGIIAAPTVTTLTLPETSGETKTLSVAIEVGFTGAKLSFDNAIRIVLANQAGKRAGYIRTGIDFTEITNICALDDQATGDALSADGDCKIDAGSDLVIWTKHFTTFASYTQTTNSDSSDNNDSGSSNHNHKNKKKKSSVLATTAGTNNSGIAQNETTAQGEENNQGQNQSGGTVEGQNTQNNQPKVENKSSEVLGEKTAKGDAGSGFWGSIWMWLVIIFLGLVGFISWMFWKKKEARY